MTADSLRCDVCGGPAIGVACSALGAISFAYCRACAVNGAEPRGILEGMVLDMMSGPPPFTPDVEVADWLLDGVTTLIDGEYVVAREALKLPGAFDIARYKDDGGPVDLEGWAWQVMRDSRERVDQSNRQHALTGPHEGCTCTTCFMPSLQGRDGA
jgi:hypothetical protein